MKEKRICSKRIRMLKMVFYISQTTRNNLICTDMQEAIVNLILNKQAAASVLMCMVNCMVAETGDWAAAAPGIVQVLLAESGRPPMPQCCRSQGCVTAGLFSYTLLHSGCSWRSPGCLAIDVILLIFHSYSQRPNRRVLKAPSLFLPFTAIPQKYFEKGKLFLLGFDMLGSQLCPCKPGWWPGHAAPLEKHQACGWWPALDRARFVLLVFILLSF